jgi:hypothetical protein
MRRPAIPLLSLVLASCAIMSPSPPPEETPAQAQERRARAPRPAYNLAGYPPAVRDGYIDGCESAKGSEYARKVESRFAADPRYRMGWNDGFSICSRK